MQFVYSQSKNDARENFFHLQKSHALDSYDSEISEQFRYEHSISIRMYQKVFIQTSGLQ